MSERHRKQITFNNLVKELTAPKPKKRPQMSNPKHTESYQITDEQREAEFQSNLELLREIDSRVCEYNVTDDEQVELFDETDDVIAVISLERFEELGCV